MNAISSYRDLIAWQKSYALVLQVYRLSAAFPADERYTLVSQVRRASLSVVCNIAEGWGRGSRSDYRRFVQMSRGSIYELQTQMWVARDLGYIQPDCDVFALIEEVDRLVNGLLRAL